MATGSSATKVVTGKVRLSYAHLFEPFSNNDGQPAKYSTTLLIPKTDKATIAKLEAAQQAALENGKTKTFGGSIPKNWVNTIHDGDEEADLKKNPEYEGHMYMAVSSKTKPGVVDQNVQPILDSTEVYSGCYARVSINCYPFNKSGNKGVSFGLNHVQKLADGEFLGGRSKADDDFDAVDDEGVL
jgi:hypothetical protein